ncbi:MAG: phage holin family protein, partial [Anaerolineae bacterium]
MRRAWRLGWRFLTTALVNSLSLFTAVLITPGISFDFSPRLVPAWVSFALFIGLVNALVRPMVVYLAYPVTWLTIGLPTVLMDSLLLLFVGRLWPGFYVDAFWPSAVLGAVVLPASNVLFSALVSTERQRTLYDWVIRRLGRRRPAGAQPAPHGVVFVQIDGLSYTALRHALREGIMPALESLLEQGRFRLMAWDCGVPSQTSSVQAGIMYGDSFNIPAFRFLDRASGQVIVSNRPEGARLLEQRYLGNGYRGLLRGGSSTANVFSGEAEQAIFTVGDHRNTNS